jgi:hypothetical protein
MVSAKWEHALKVKDDREPRLFMSIEKDGKAQLIGSKDDGAKPVDSLQLRKDVEPWLTALFQSEHLSLLVGTGLTRGLCSLAGFEAANLGVTKFQIFQEQIEPKTKEWAKVTGRGEPNVEDQLRVANALLKGLDIYASEAANFRGSKKLRAKMEKLRDSIEALLNKLVSSILADELRIISCESDLKQETFRRLINFLMSFASRSGTRERLHIFTTNYDRVLEFGAELAGIRLIDRFIGSLAPVFRSSRIDVDMHYNPPGIRGEPRYLEGIVRYTKLHGSLDWIYQNGYVNRMALPFGAESFEPYLPDRVSADRHANSLLIYPNEAKDRETAEYPYVELFRDFAAAICRPNSTLVVYGFSFGDEHINRVIRDMLTIPSAHLVIIAYRDEGGRIQEFYHSCLRPAQISLLIGKHFGALPVLVDYYLPKPSIDWATIRMAELLKARGISEPKEFGQVSKDDTSA